MFTSCCLCKATCKVKPNLCEHDTAINHSYPCRPSPFSIKGHGKNRRQARLLFAKVLVTSQYGSHHWLKETCFVSVKVFT